MSDTDESEETSPKPKSPPKTKSKAVGKKTVSLSQKQQEPATSKGPSPKATKAAETKKAPVPAETEQPKYAPFDAIREYAEAERMRKSAKKLEEIAKRPFEICEAIQDLLHVAILQFLSNTARSAYTDAGFAIVIVDDEAIDFHSAPSHQSDFCRPVKVLLYRPLTADQMDLLRSNNEREKRRYYANRDAKFVADLETLGNSAGGFLTNFFVALPPATLAALEKQCRCKLTASQTPFDIAKSVETKEFTIFFNYTTAAGTQESIDVLKARWYYDNVTQGPVPRFTTYARRLYGTLGYLLERAEELQESGDPEVAAEYARQYSMIRKAIDDGALSCASIGSSSKACLVQSLARVSPDDEREIVRMAGNIRSHVNNPQALVRRLIGGGFYPPTAEPFLVDAIRRDKLGVEEIELLSARLETDMGRPRSP